MTGIRSRTHGDASTVQLTWCPECGAPMEILDRDVWESTDGPVEHARARCLDRHLFLGPVESLTRPPRSQA